MAQILTLPGAVTAEELRPRIAANLGPKDRLREKGGWFYDLRVDRSAGVGVVVRVKPDPAGTRVTVMAFVPSLPLRFVKSFVLWVFLGRKWRAFEAEVAGWLASGGPVRPQPDRAAVQRVPPATAASDPSVPSRRIACPKCHAPFKIPAGSTRVRCPSCGAAGVLR